MQAPNKTQHCPVLTRVERDVLDRASREYGLPWHVKANKHYKIYLGNILVTVRSLSKDGNYYAQTDPVARLRRQIERAVAQPENSHDR